MGYADTGTDLPALPLATDFATPRTGRRTTRDADRTGRIGFAGAAGSVGFGSADLRTWPPPTLSCCSRPATTVTKPGNQFPVLRFSDAS